MAVLSFFFGRGGGRRRPDPFGRMELQFGRGHIEPDTWLVRSGAAHGRPDTFGQIGFQFGCGHVKPDAWLVRFGAVHCRS